MLYTSYFGKLRQIDSRVVPIAICGKAPDYWKGLQYKKLAPKWDFFKVWKETRDNHYYVKCFNEQVLGLLNVDEVYRELNMLANGSEDIVLLCYEKPEDFCHRHLVANWFRENGYKIREY